MKPLILDRRAFCKLSLASSVTIPVTLGSLANAGGHLPKLEESDPQAMALGYLHDATAVDGGKQAKYASGQNCSNCVLYQGKDGDNWGPCGIFPGRRLPPWVGALPTIRKPKQGHLMIHT